MWKRFSGALQPVLPGYQNQALRGCPLCGPCGPCCCGWDVIASKPACFYHLLCLLWEQKADFAPHTFKRLVWGHCLGSSVSGASRQVRCLQLCSVPQLEAHRRAGLSLCVAKGKARLLKLQKCSCVGLSTPTHQGEETFGNGTGLCQGCLHNMVGKEALWRDSRWGGWVASIVLQREVGTEYAVLARWRESISTVLYKYLVSRLERGRELVPASTFVPREIWKSLHTP